MKIANHLIFHIIKSIAFAIGRITKSRTNRRYDFPGFRDDHRLHIVESR